MDEQEQLRPETDRARRELAERDRQIAEQAKPIAESEKTIADLERQLVLRQQNSTTSSKPPSSDGLAGRQRIRGRRTTSRRKPGVNQGTRAIVGVWCPWSACIASSSSFRTRVAIVGARCRRGAGRCTGRRARIR
jgi:hypothetical protein